MVPIHLTVPNSVISMTMMSLRASGVVGTGIEGQAMMNPPEGDTVKMQDLLTFGSYNGERCLITCHG